MRHYPLIAIALTGLATGIGQILVLRELLVVFYGNELSTGLVLTCWLLWTSAGSSLGGRFSSAARYDKATLCTGLLLLALVNPSTLLWVRSARLAWSIPLGELISPALMLAIALTATSLFCLLSGFMFTACWKAQLRAAESEEDRPILVYVVEALGSATGGLCFYFLLLPRFSQFMAACLTSLTVLAFVVAIMRPWKDLRGAPAVPTLVGSVCCVSIVALSLNSARLDEASHRWQWGDELMAVRDTPYNNLALLRNASQFSLFGNGLWFFSIPDPKSAEYAVHLVLLQHPLPKRVLLIGGGAVGLVPEILKYPSIVHVDVVEPDPESVDLLEAYLPAFMVEPIHDPRVHIHNRDAGSFVRRSRTSYDAVLSTLGDPMNAELNRFYTVEFFQSVSRLLGERGVFSFAVSASDILGPVQVRLLRSCYNTARAVFPQVLVFLADSARFFAANRSGLLVKDPQELAARISRKNLNLQYVRRDYLFDFLNPMRLDYIASLLESGPVRPLNRDFAPTCYFNNLLLWASQLHPWLEKAMLALSDIGKTRFWLALGVALVVYVALSRGGWLGSAIAIQTSVMVMGGTQLAFEIILLVVFQILEGFVYQQLALIVTFFMTGAALGAGLESLLALRIRSARRWFVLTQIAFAAFVLISLKILLSTHQVPGEVTAVLSTSVMFSLLAGVAGLLGGLHFALAVKVASATNTSSAAAAGRIYAVDLLGAASGSVLASLYILPVYGVPMAMVVLSAASLGSACAVAIE